MVSPAQFLGPRRVAIFAKPLVPDPRFISGLLAFVLDEAVVTPPDSVSLDLALARQHRRVYDWTRSPIEPTVTDGAIRKPDSVRVEGVLSAHPIRGLITGLAGAAGSIVRRDREQMVKLRKVADKREPVVLVTPERPYGSVGIRVIAERWGRAERVEVSLEFEEVRIIAPFLPDVMDVGEMLTGAIATSAMGRQTPAAAPDPGGLG